MVYCRSGLGTEVVDLCGEGVGVLSVGEGSDPIVDEVSVGARRVRRGGDGVLFCLSCSYLGKFHDEG